MKRTALRLALLASLASVAVASAPALAQQQKPNILFILADNVGYGDIGAYGGGELRGAPTPRIDRLAAESLRLTQYLVEPRVHAVARRVHDRPVFHPLRAVAGCGRGHGHLASGAGNHDGRDAARRRICNGDLRQMASWVAALQPAAEQRLRRILRHPAGRHVGRVRHHSSGPPDQGARSPAGQRAAHRRGQARRAAASGEALHRRGAARDRLGTGGPRRRFHEAPEGGGQAVLSLPPDLADALPKSALEAFRGRVAHRTVRQLADGRRCDRRQHARLAQRARSGEGHHRGIRLRQRPRRAWRDVHSAATCRTWDRPDPIAARSAT